MRTWIAALALAFVALAGCGKDDASSSSSSGSSSSGSGSTASSSTSGTGSSGTSSSSSSSASSSSSGSSGFEEGPHSPFPQVPDNGGPTLHHMQVVTITYDGYAYQQEADSFADWMVGSSWLTTVGADYDVHDGTHIASVHLSDVAPTSLSDTQIQQTLTTLLGNGEVPPPGAILDDAGTTVTEPIYAIYYPETTSINDGSGLSCEEFGGYHNLLVYQPSGGAAVNVAYAVLPTCPGAGMSIKDYLTVASSHEYIEAATDPYPNTSFGGQDTSTYDIDDFNNPWSLVPGEVGDLCVGTTYADASGFLVQRIWSNSAAAMQPSISPCVPGVNFGYFNVTTDLQTAQFPPAGGTVTYQVQAWSDRPIDAKWDVFLEPTDGDFVPSFVLATANGQRASDTNGSVQMGNGDTATLTFTVPPNTEGESYAGYQITSVPVNGGDRNFWPIEIIVGG